MPKSGNCLIAVSLVLISAFGTANAQLSTNVSATADNGVWEGGWVSDELNGGSLSSSTSNPINEAGAGVDYIYLPSPPNYTTYYLAGQATGSASASGQSSYVGLQGTAMSSNNGAVAGNFYNPASSSAEMQAADTLTFTGSGTATFHFSLTGNISNSGYGWNSSIYGPVVFLQLSTTGFGASNLSALNAGSGNLILCTDAAEFSGYPSGSVIVVNGPFNYQWTTTLDYSNQQTISVSNLIQISTQEGYASANLQLTSVEFSTPGSSVVDSTGAIAFAYTAPTDADVPLPLWALGLLGAGLGTALTRRRGHTETTSA